MVDSNLHTKDLPETTFNLITQVLFFSTVNVHSMANDQNLKKEVERNFVWANMNMLLWNKGKSTLLCQLHLFYSMLYAPNSLKINELLNSSLGQIIYFLPLLPSFLSTSLPPPFFFFSLSSFHIY